jgi:hypothetical protein
MDARGQIQLQLRSVDAVTVRDLPGTVGARQPFFSPDGQWVGYFTQSEIRKVSLAGGNPITVAENINGAGVSFGVWTEDNNIVFGTLTTGLRRVSADGGAVSDLTKVDTSQGESYHILPALVPSSRAVVFNVRYRDPAKNRIDAVMLDSGQRSVVLENARTPHVLESGHILFQRDEALLTAPFDVKQLKITGPLVPLVDEVRRDSPVSPISIAELAVSRNGTLAYLPAVDADSALGIVSRAGVFEGLGPPPNKFNLPRVSPDGHAVAFLVYRGQGSEARVYDRDRGSMTKVTQEGRDEGVAWRDDQSMAIFSRRKEASGIFLRSPDGPERLLVPYPPDVTLLRNGDWSPDGKTLAYTLQTGLLHDIWVLTMGEKPTTAPFLQGAAFSEHSPAFSPNGQWLAYVSTESGRDEVWVQRFPKGEHLNVSADGGTGPAWNRDGTELFFQNSSADEPQMMAVTVSPAGESLRLGKPTALFNLRAADRNGVIGQYYVSGNTGMSYDVLPDGRFVMVRGADPAGSREIVLVQNWFESLKSLGPAK